ncbi:acyl carrier protein [Paenibacillaceae bacterium]|nr:acyl carrier protein [Paenibacillaceae bacterium]
MGVDDNFFELGGNSLKAVQVVSCLSQTFEVDIHDVFQFQTIAALAQKISPKMT